jgi:hypothetical protein
LILEIISLPFSPTFRTRVEFAVKTISQSVAIPVIEVKGGIKAGRAPMITGEKE